MKWMRLVSHREIIAFQLQLRKTRSWPTLHVIYFSITNKAPSPTEFYFIELTLFHKVQNLSNDVFYVAIVHYRSGHL